MFEQLIKPKDVTYYQLMTMIDESDGLSESEKYNTALTALRISIASCTAEANNTFPSNVVFGLQLETEKAELTYKQRFNREAVKVLMSTRTQGLDFNCFINRLNKMKGGQYSQNKHPRWMREQRLLLECTVTADSPVIFHTVDRAPISLCRMMHRFAEQSLNDYFFD